MELYLNNDKCNIKIITNDYSDACREQNNCKTSEAGMYMSNCLGATSIFRCGNNQNIVDL